jgi:hypothetical protein
LGSGTSARNRVGSDQIYAYIRGVADRAVTAARPVAVADRPTSARGCCPPFTQEITGSNPVGDTTTATAASQFYFFRYQFLSSPISLGGYVLEGLHTRKKW